jgi:outer membrane protein OmpA-like peptidoglycan-associated protein
MNRLRLILLAGTVLPAMALSAPAYAQQSQTSDIVVAQRADPSDDSSGGGGGKRERAERPDRAERPERAERPDRAEKAATPERAERPERAEKPDRPARDVGGASAGAGGEERPSRREMQQDTPRVDTKPDRTDRQDAQPDRARDRKTISDEPAARPKRDSSDTPAATTSDDKPSRQDLRDRMKDRDATKPDAVKPDASRPDATKSDSSKSDATKPDASRSDAIRSDTVKPDAARSGDDSDRRSGAGASPSLREGGDRTSPRDNAPGDKDRLQDLRDDRKDGRDADRKDRIEDRQDRSGDRVDDRGNDRLRDLRDDRSGDRRDDLRNDRASDRRDDDRDLNRDQRRDRFEQRMRDDRRDDSADRRRGEDDRIDRVRSERRERRDGDVTIITEGDRTIYREGGRTVIRRDENLRFRDGARDVREDRDGEFRRTVITRPDGSEVVTLTDDDGRLVRRTRRYRGEEYVLIDNRPRGGGRPGVFVDLGLAPPRVSIPRERYIVDADEASYEQIDEAFSAPPVERLERSYSLDEIRQNAPLRERVRSVDLDTVTFDTGSWDVRDDQIKKLENVGLAMESAIKKNPRTVFMVEGHTDAVGNDDDNLSLSDRRAQAVAEILTKYFTIPAENLTTQGYGEQYLKVKTDGPEERNRRVTVRNITQLLTSEK